LINNSLDLTFHPLTPERWLDLEQLFGKHGATGGCWCMWWKMTSAEFTQNKGEGNKTALKKLIEEGEIPGILAYHAGMAVGWCAIGPRAAYPRLNRSKILAPVDEQPVWSIVCFFVARPYRKKGITMKLIQAAVEYAADNGASIVEAYPVDPKTRKSPDPFVYTGLFSAFTKAHFTEVFRRSETRPIMRHFIEKFH